MTVGTLLDTSPHICFLEMVWFLKHKCLLALF
uniref:Uncharacterized protein n=1 Tax=Anguilla anguilla TaxID=7936 RepID=A0A0E9R1L3_ANGAN